MQTFIIIIHLLIVSAMIGVVLLQRSEGGGFVSGGTGSMMSVRGSADLMTRTTWILGTIFFVLGLVLTIMAAREQGSTSVVDRLKVNAIDPTAMAREQQQQQAPTPAPGGPAPLQAPAPNPFLPPAPTAPAPAPIAPATK